MDLAARIDRLTEAYRACRLCPRDCGVDRLQGPAGAFCRLGAQATVYKELLSQGEEAALSPTWLVDLGGCSLRCLFCTEWAHVTEPAAAPAVRLDPAWFARKHAQRQGQGARTVSFVGGDPTVSMLAVFRALQAVPPPERLPVVWNCNGQLSDLALDLLDGVVSTWVVDLKFGNADCARRLAGAGSLDPRAEVDRTLRALRGHRRPDAAGPLPHVLVRHLVMPGHLDCCTRPALDWLAAHHPEAVLNLMTVYVPMGPAAAQRLATAPELADFATTAEVAAALAHARATRAAVLVDGR